MNLHHVKHTRSGLIVLRTVTLIAMMLSLFSIAHVAYAQDSSVEDNGRNSLIIAAGDQSSVGRDLPPEASGDAEGALIQETAVMAASAAAFLIPDTGGMDQKDTGTDPGGDQQDLAGVFVDGATFGFAWDETTLSGNNSNDMGTYFLEADGSVTSVCYSIQFEDDGTITSGFPTSEVFSCTAAQYGNAKCTGKNSTDNEYTATCSDPVEVSPYFAADPDGDLEGQCTLTGLGGNDPNDLLYINTCAKPSASPSSLSNDCIFDPDLPDPGFLQLVKTVADGAAIPADFSLTATKGTESISGAGDTGVRTVSVDESGVGEFTLTEASSLIDDGTMV